MPLLIPSTIFYTYLCLYFRHDKLVLETDLKEKDSKTFMAATEDKLQRSEEELENLKETIRKSKEELKITQENLHVTISEKDDYKSELESVKQELGKVGCDLKNKETELQHMINELESVRDILTDKVKVLEEEKVLRSGNITETQKLLDEKCCEIEGLEKSVNAMRNGFIWLQGLRDNQTYKEVSIILKNPDVEGSLWII